MIRTRVKKTTLTRVSSGTFKSINYHPYKITLTIIHVRTFEFETNYVVALTSVRHIYDYTTYSMSNFEACTNDAYDRSHSNVFGD